MFDETAQYVLVGKLMKQGHEVEFDYMEHGRDFSRWHNGKIVDIIHATGPNTNNFLVWYVRKLGETTRKESVRVPHAYFDKLQLFKLNGKWKLSDRKHEPDDDEPVNEDTRKHDSVVLSMLMKALDAGKKMRISVDTVTAGGRERRTGDLFKVSATNGTYSFWYDDDSVWPKAQRVWMYRTPSPAMFDEYYTVKSADGVPTLMHKKDA